MEKFVIVDSLKEEGLKKNHILIARGQHYVHDHIFMDKKISISSSYKKNI